MPKWFVLTILALGACTDTAVDPASTAPRYRGFHAFSLQLGVSDNAETVRLLPNSDLAVLSSSKARRATLLQVGADVLVERRSKLLLPDDASESELTNLAVAPNGVWAAFTHTLETRDPDSGLQTSCGGELLIVDVSDTERFGDILNTVPVGPMPDAVAISPDGHWLAVANERDSAWGGKCEVAGYEGSVSLIDLSAGVAAASETVRVTMHDGSTDGREPESLTFGPDSDLLAVTLQDSHEVALMRVSALQTLESPTSDDITLTRLPANALGMDPWPDGIVAFTAALGATYFAVAGEWNDTLLVLDASGTVVANHDILPSELPSSFPRDLSGEAPLFRPDSLATFVREGTPYVAASLKHAGAVAVWDLSTPETPILADAIKIGRADTGTPTSPSSIGSEGISANSDGAAILCANEGEGSVSLVRPAP